MISMIYCRDMDATIGDDKGLVYHCIADMDRFVRITNGRKVVVGRKTYDLLPDKAKQRMNPFVIGREHYRPEDVFKLEGDVIVIGGAEIYSMFEPFAEVVYETVLDATSSGDSRYWITYRNFDLVNSVAEMLPVTKLSTGETETLLVTFNTYRRA